MRAALLLLLLLLLLVVVVVIVVVVVAILTHPPTRTPAHPHTRTACQGALGASINAVSLALMDAGVPMKDFVVACTAGYLEQATLVGTFPTHLLLHHHHHHHHHHHCTRPHRRIIHV